jgi:hypothetical protein
LIAASNAAPNWKRLKGNAMQLSNTAPLLFAATIALAAAAAIAPANAAEVRLSDASYIAEARCVGLTQGLHQTNLSLSSHFDGQSASRPRVAEIMADQARETAAREARLSPYWTSAAMHEAATTCAQFGAHVSSLARNGR